MGHNGTDTRYINGGQADDRDATALVVDAIEAGDASASEFDVEAIVADLYDLAGGWDFRTVDHDEFWSIVERHAR